jgi:hypothetical protein
MENMNTSRFTLTRTRRFGKEVVHKVNDASAPGISLLEIGKPAGGLRFVVAAAGF